MNTIKSFNQWLKTVKRYERKPSMQLVNRGFSLAISSDIEWGEMSRDIIADWIKAHDLKDTEIDTFLLQSYPNLKAASPSK